MGLFRNHTRRESTDFRWPFKPIDSSAQPKPRAKQDKRATLKIGNPVLIESSREVTKSTHIPQTAPLTQDRTPRWSINDKPDNFEPLFQDSYASPDDEQLPFELSAASAARFHEYLQDLSSTTPTPDDSEYEQDEQDDISMVEIEEGEIATTISLASPGKPKMIDLSVASSFSSSRSASSSYSDVRISGFLHSRRASEVSECETPFTPASFFDSSEESTPDEECGNQLNEAHNIDELKKMEPGMWLLSGQLENTDKT